MSSNLSRIMTAEVFESAYKAFMEQADDNRITKKSNGKMLPVGITKADNELINSTDGGTISQHFGQGGASDTPYICWYVVSVYYVVYRKKIVLGIERDRYPHLTDLRGFKCQEVGNKKTKVAIFYETPIENLNYKELYDKFIQISEEVMRIGL